MSSVPTRHVAPPKRVLITGAASGIGEATARRAVRLGHQVIALDIADSVHDLERLEGVAAVVGDVTESDTLNRAVELATQRFGGLDGAVAAAGITCAGTVDSMDVDDWSRVIRTNLTAVFLLAKATLPAFRLSGGGSFVAVASQVGLVGYPENVAYCAAKAGVVNLVRAMAVDVSKEGIRANAVCPGPVDTPMLHEGFAQTGENITLAANRVPAGRVADPDEIAATACFLLSDDARFVCGAAWTVDGGYTAQ
jgi:NAD(P)-dependent dehydrogenase (short-subunit alcohol dehydrogenase family)